MRMSLPDLATWYWFNVVVRVLASALTGGVVLLTWRSSTPIGRRTRLCVALLCATAAYFTLFKTSGDVSRGIHNVLYIGFALNAAQTLRHMRNGAIVLGIKPDALRDAVTVLDEEGADERFK